MRRAGFWVGVALVFSVVACGGDRNGAELNAADVDRGHAVPILRGEVRPAGTQLKGGYRVPEGAVAVGPVLPTLFYGVDATKWASLMVVDGPVERVYDRFVDQSREVGPPGLPWSGAACRALAADVCAASAPSAYPRARQGRWIDLRVVRGDDCAGWESDAWWSFIDFGGAEPPAAPQAPNPGSAKLPSLDPPRRQHLPVAGDPLGIDDAHSIRIVEGSQPLIAAGVNMCFGDRVVLMRTTDGEHAFNTYARRLRALRIWEGRVPFEESARRQPGWDSRSFSVSNTDTNVMMELFVPRGGAGHEYIRFSFSNGA